MHDRTGRAPLPCKRLARSPGSNPGILSGPAPVTYLPVCGGQTLRCSASREEGIPAGDGRTGTAVLLSVIHETEVCQDE